MTTLPERQFTTRAGKVLRFSALGFGGAPLGNMFRRLQEDECDETVRAAWNCGMRYFDTAPLYGHGLSEIRLGRVLAEHDRNDYLLSTKVGRVLDPCAPGEENSGIYRDTPQCRVRFDYSYDGVMRSFEESLARLGVDRVDILYVHDVDARNHGGRTAANDRIDELLDCGGWRALSALRDGGAVVAIGAGVNEWEPCARLLEVADPDLFLLAGRYTLLEQDPVDTLFPLCAARGAGIVVGGPFNSGVLAGKSSYDYSNVTASVAARVEALAAVCRDHDVMLPQAALQFPFAHSLVACVIPGTQSVAETEQNVALLKRPVPLALWDDLKQRGLLQHNAPTPVAGAMEC